MKLPIRISHHALMSIVLCFLVALSGCTSVKFVSDYDEQTDRVATELQTKVETFLIKMERVAGTPEGTYANNVQFYDEMLGALSALRVRANTLVKNKITVEMIETIETNIGNLKNLHERQGDKGLKKQLSGPARGAINAQFAALIKFENEKKRGER